MNKEDIYNKVCRIISDYLRLETEELSPETHIVNDIGVDSLALVELGFKFSEAFSIGMFEPNENNLILDNLVNKISQEMNH
ncbi:MAG: hypothetical protein JXR70_10360 [Spirochaetales bacterium]|nr:hypothetical protein [Spirochaetales bacterium]